jgi:undecaprenyl-diphosphatase
MPARAAFGAWDERAVRTLHTAASRSRGLRFLTVFLGTYLPFLAAFAYAAYLFTAFPLHTAFAVLAEAVIAGVVARFVIGSPLRFLFPRTRPHKTHGLPELIREESLSLPSGHALFFFAFAASACFVSPVTGAALLVCAALIGAARVAAGIHYPSDVLLGALIGVSVATALHPLFLA